MKCRLGLSVILGLSAAHSFALEPQAPPSPSVDAVPRIGTISKGAEGNSIFVGHYGEVIEFPYGWTAEAELRGMTEAAYFHRKSHDVFGFKPFNPKPADYKLENFAPLGLMELVVVPKNAPGGLRRLADIRAAKEKELKASGAAFRIYENPLGGDWPLGTFVVVMQAPHRIEQTYAESPSEFYILTEGGGIEPGDYGLSRAQVLNYAYASQLIRRTLGRSLTAMHGRTVMGRLFERVSATPDFLEDMRPLRIAGILGLCMAPMLVLAFWPGKSPFGRRARLYGRSLLLFSLASALLGFLVVYVPARAAGLVWRRPSAAMVAVEVWTPLIAWAAAVYFGSARTIRIMSVTCALAASWCALLIFEPQSSSFTSASELLGVNILMAFMTGIVFATGFTLAFGKPAAGEGESR